MNQTPSPHLNSEFAERCRLYNEKFSRTERQIAEYILENEEAAADCSIQALAENARVGVASVIRFSKTLGYSGFADMKFQMQQRRLVLDRQDINIAEQDDANVVKQKVLRHAEVTLEKCIMSNSNETLAQVSNAIAHADTVLFVGAGASSGVAMSNASIFMSMGIRSLYISDSLMYARASALLRPQDVLVALSYSGYSKNVGDALIRAKESGATTVLLTAFKHTLLAKYADYELYTVPRNMANNVNTSTTAMAQFAVMQILQSMVQQKNEPHIQKNLQRIRAYNKNADKYDVHLQEIPTGPVQGIKETK